MTALNPYQKYKQQSIMTASPGELTLMLYNGCIKFIGTARLHIENGDIQRAHDAIIRAQMIIEEFMSTLNFSYEISERIYIVYEYLLHRLIEANIRKDISILDEVLTHVTGLRDTWEQVIKKTGDPRLRDGGAVNG
ncbi:MAG: flagellar export chaperone FliS [Clostridiales bacterium]|jgi:flagellar protein FliS|nr:flagellar export chaperone FliS [Clostridiales bacterium]